MTKFFKSIGFLVLCLFLCAPAGIFLLFRHHRFKPAINISAAVLFGCLFVAECLSVLTFHTYRLAGDAVGNPAVIPPASVSETSAAPSPSSAISSGQSESSSAEPSDDYEPVSLSEPPASRPPSSESSVPPQKSAEPELSASSGQTRYPPEPVDPRRPMPAPDDEDDEE